MTNNIGFELNQKLSDLSLALFNLENIIGSKLLEGLRGVEQGLNSIHGKIWENEHVKESN